MRTEYWIVTDDEVREKTGQGLSHWTSVLDGFGAGERKSNESVGHLVESHGVPRYWARTLVTRYSKGIRE
ncbi:MAG TPA: DUF4287 domain-containing protein [Fimbriimonas sp.]|nr:DUF4287 domain-containing protein [Fimbriimonas sp.]